MASLFSTTTYGGISGLRDPGGRGAAGFEIGVTPSDLGGWAQSRGFAWWRLEDCACHWKFVRDVILLLLQSQYRVLTLRR